MKIEDEIANTFEEQCKRKLFNKIKDLHSLTTESIYKIKESAELIGLDSNIPNIVTTINNKIIELQNEFKKSGISMWVEKVEDSRELKLRQPFVSNAVQSDILEYYLRAMQSIERYYKVFMNVIVERNTYPLEKTSPIKRFFAKARRLIIKVKQRNILYTDEEKNLINAYLSDYRDIDNKAWNYNLRDNVVSSIVKKIKEEDYSAYVLPELLKQCIIPDLEKLGLADLIPELQLTLIEEYKKTDVKERSTNAIVKRKEEDIGVRQEAEVNNSSEQDDENAR